MPFFPLPTSQIKFNLQLYPKNITFLRYFLFHIPTAMPRIAQVVIFTPSLQIPSSNWSSSLLLLFLFLSSTDYIWAPQHFRHVPPIFSLACLTINISHPLLSWTSALDWPSCFLSWYHAIPHPRNTELPVLPWNVLILSLHSSRLCKHSL